MENITELKSDFISKHCEEETEDIISWYIKKKSLVIKL